MISRVLWQELACLDLDTDGRLSLHQEEPVARCGAGAGPPLTASFVLLPTLRGIRRILVSTPKGGLEIS